MVVVGYAEVEYIQDVVFLGRSLFQLRCGEMAASTPWKGT